MGLPERTAREHSLPWLLEFTDFAARRQRRQQAAELTFAVLAAATGAGSEQAAAEVTRLLGELIPADEDEDLSHLLDPNAQTDWAALSQAGLQGMPLAFGRVHGPAVPKQEM